MVKYWDEPDGRGSGTPTALFAEFHLVSDVIGDTEYLISYIDAVPTIPSSPGAVQYNVTE